MTAVFVLFAVAGGVLLLCLGYHLAVWLQRPACCRMIMVLPLSGRMENIEQILRFSLETSRNSGAVRMVVVDFGLDDMARSICQRFCRTHPGIFLTGSAELPDAVRLEAE